MADIVSVTLISNADEVKEALEEQIEAALVAIGLAAETNAKKEITTAVYDTPESPNYVRTGRLRNSLTHAVIPKEKAVLIGTVVEYAPFVELGTTTMPPRPYLRPAINNHVAEYKALAEAALKH